MFFRVTRRQGGESETSGPTNFEERSSDGVGGNAFGRGTVVGESVVGPCYSSKYRTDSAVGVATTAENDGEK